MKPHHRHVFTTRSLPSAVSVGSYTSVVDKGPNARVAHCGHLRYVVRFPSVLGITRTITLSPDWICCARCRWAASVRGSSPGATPSFPANKARICAGNMQKCASISHHTHTTTHTHTHTHTSSNNKQRSIKHTNGCKRVCVWDDPPPLAPHNEPGFPARTRHQRSDPTTTQTSRAPSRLPPARCIGTP